MEGDLIKIHKELLPLSWLYGLGVKARNLMFDIGLLKSRSFKIPIIAVGNITVGGTGKTPHVEYLIEMLRSTFHIAVLSRGYKRKSKGFVKADAGTAVQDIGDEPYQMQQKFKDITVAVDKNRCHGIDRLVNDDSKLDVILLDDAFQHRYVKPGINILLVDYHRLIIYDKLLPAGRLREPLSGKNRADIVIVTKCPKDMKPMEYRVINKAMDLYPYQQLFFTTIGYGSLKAAFKTGEQKRLDELKGVNVLLLTGIASPEQMVHDMSPLCKSIQPMVFADHYQYKAKDAQLINKTFDSMPEPKLIVTTEKDTTRLTADIGLSEKVKEHIYSLPINISFMLEQENNFNNQIIDYVHKNSRNSILAKRKDDNKPKDGNRAGDRPRTISFRNH